jgi:L-malate glycosyltransferase
LVVAESGEGSPKTIERFHIGVAGPITLRQFTSDLDVAPHQVPRGLGGTPVNHLLRAWLDQGYRVTLATLDPSVPVGEAVTLQGPRLTVVVGAYRSKHRARDSFRLERTALRDALTRHRPDAITAHWSYEFALGAIESGLPTAVTVHDVPKVIFRLQPTPYRLMRWAMHRRAMALARRIVFNSPYTRDHLGHPRSAGSEVLPNALPDANWKLMERRLPDPTQPLFVSVNNGFGRLKNVHNLIRAFNLVRVALPGARLQLIGSGFEVGGSADAWATKNGAGSGITFLGTLDYATTMARVRSADILVHPSLEESFGYTLIEAASVGTPVIGGVASGAVPWVLDGGNCGVLVDVESPQAVAAGMLSLATDPNQWQAIRTRALESGRRRFSASVVAAAYVRLLRGIADAGTERSR